MLEPFFFALGIVNSLLLIAVFLVRRKRLDLVQRFGWIYLLLAIPAAFGVFLVFREQQDVRYAIFLGIFLVYLVMEWLLDHVLNASVRDNWRRNWGLLTPYLALYYAMNYGFVVMPWKTSLTWGLIMAGLFAVQLVTNLTSHTKSSK